MRLLLIEDDAALADGLKRVLQRSALITHAATGGDAVRAASAEQFDLVVLDLGLPDMDGLDVLATLRMNPQTGPILILTARDSETDRVRGLDLGADDYVAKPFSLAEFEARIRALMRRRQAVRSPVLKFCGLTLDTIARTARVDGEDVRLTPREWCVLEYLLLRAGQVVSKEQLLETICSWDDSLAPNSIEVYVSRLRTKIERAGIVIRTVRGFGYIIEEPAGPPS
jgi:two-component system, OmpR family, response regulator